MRNQFALADLKMDRLLDTFDEWARAHPRDAEVGAPERFEPTRVPASSPLHLDFRNGEIKSIVWATGFHPDYSWLHVPVLDRKGCLRHDGGIVDAPGLYAIGLPILRRRKSTFIHGAEDDARDIVAHLAGYLAGSGRDPVEREVIITRSALLKYASQVRGERAFAERPLDAIVHVAPEIPVNVHAARITRAAVSAT